MDQSVRHSHVIEWGAVIGHNDETGHPILLAVVHKHNCKSVRLPNNISIFRAELYALVLARNSLLCADVPLRNYSLTHTPASEIFHVLTS